MYYTRRNARIGVTLEIMNEGITNIKRQTTKVPILTAKIMGRSKVTGTVVT